jgi:hypothetical protein
MAFTPLNQAGSNFTPANAGTVSRGGVPLQASPGILSRAASAAAGVGGSLMSRTPEKVTNGLGLKNVVDVMSDDFANILSPKAMQESGAPQASLTKNIGAGLQLGSTIAAAQAAPAAIVPSVVAGASIGAANQGGEALAEGAPVTEVARKTAIGAAVGGAVSGVVSGFSKLLGKVGDKIMTSVIRPTQADKADGFAIETVKQYSLGGSLPKTLEKTQIKIGELSAQLAGKLQATDQGIDLNTVLQQTADELTDSSKLKGFGANAKIQNTIEALRNEVQLVGGQLTIPDAQIVKQASGSFGAWQYGKPDPESKATEIVYNTFYNKLKVAIEEASPEGVREINKELSKLIPVQNAVLRRLPVAERNNLISLSDMIGLVGSAHSPAALGPTILNIISKSGTTGAALSKFGPKLGRVAIPAAFSATALPAESQ